MGSEDGGTYSVSIFHNHRETRTRTGIKRFPTALAALGKFAAIVAERGVSEAAD